MFKVCGFVISDEFDHAAPHPTGSMSHSFGKTAEEIKAISELSR
jgi:hypothetical protein